ncbi:MAG: histidine phosphatase family protein [Deltaproteobacteria bacterium]|nr:histidine phosphatase family protein [Deltaproteobacteria bacterium]
MELILVRHGLPLTVERVDGAPANPALSELGHAQALAVAAHLGSESIDRIYSSHLQRAHQTALPLAETLGLEVELEPRVAEYDRDSQVYVPLEELRERDYQAWLDFMSRGYPDGMDLDDFRRDVLAGMEDIIAANPGGRVVVFCHGGVINTWASHVIGLGFKLFFNPDYTSVNRFLAAGGSGVRSVGSLNERAHLRAVTPGGARKSHQSAAST